MLLLARYSSGLSCVSFSPLASSLGRAGFRWQRGSHGTHGGKALSKERGRGRTTAAEGTTRGAAEAELAAQIIQASLIRSSAK